MKSAFRREDPGGSSLYIIIPRNSLLGLGGTGPSVREELDTSFPIMKILLWEFIVCNTTFSLSFSIHPQSAVISHSRASALTNDQFSSPLGVGRDVFLVEEVEVETLYYGGAFCLGGAFRYYGGAFCFDRSFVRVSLDSQKLSLPGIELIIFEFLVEIGFIFSRYPRSLNASSRLHPAQDRRAGLGGGDVGGMPLTHESCRT